MALLLRLGSYVHLLQRNKAACGSTANGGHAQANKPASVKRLKRDTLDEE